MNAPARSLESPPHRCAHNKEEHCTKRAQGMTTTMLPIAARMARSSSARPSTSTLSHIGSAFTTAATDGRSTSNPEPVSPTSSTVDERRERALSLYRRLLRGAQRMPTPNRQNYVLRKTRAEFRKHASLTDPEEIEFQLRLADTNLDTVLVQAEHLSRLFSDPNYQNYN